MPGFRRLVRRNAIISLSGLIMAVFTCLATVLAVAATPPPIAPRSHHEVAAPPVLADSVGSMSPEELREMVRMVMEQAERRKPADQSSSVPWPPILAVIGIIVGVVGALLQRSINRFDVDLMAAMKAIAQNHAAQVESSHQNDLAIHSLRSEVTLIDKDVRRLDGDVRQLDGRVAQLSAEFNEAHRRQSPTR